MDGYIKITALEDGIETEVRMNHFSKIDKLLLLDAFARGMNMDDEDLKKGLLMLPLVRELLVDHEEGGDE